MRTIDKNILVFLEELKENNNREWFEKNKPKFKNHQQSFKAFFESLSAELGKHDVIEKYKLFRIYRDVRFSKDKTPYKVHFSGYFLRATEKRRGGYYLEIKPKESFLAGGFWAPNKEDLFRIRKEFEMDSTEIREIITAKPFKKHFGSLEGDSLKTAPKGFNKEHLNIDLIRMKQFVVVKKFTEAQILAPNFIDEVNEGFKAMRSFFDYMSDVLTTDLNGNSLIE